MAVNHLEERLVAIRNQKKMLEKQAENERDQQKLWDLSRQIMDLDTEYSYILKELNR